MNDDDKPVSDNAGERTVVASADAVAAALAAHTGKSAAPAWPGAPSADPFGAPSQEDPFGAAAAAGPFGAAAPDDPFAAPPPAADPFGAPATAVFDDAPSPERLAEAEAAIEALPEAQTAAPAVPSFGSGPPGGLVGYQLNDLFEIVRFIARGGMGEVYEGRNLASGERVAIKVILPQYAADAQFMSLFRREASALERLGHDALVKYRTLAFDRATQLNYLAIEFVDGVPMSDVLDSQPADPSLVRVVLRRLAGGLGAAHSNGVIHRDLSPDNILLPDGDVARAKIIDFGIAKDTNPGEKSVVGDAFAGKFGYAAPEIFGKYKRSVGPWTDVYSLALTVLAFARGAPMDMGVTIVDALEARDHVPDLSFLPGDLQPVFTGMLEPDPEVRFRSMDAVVEALDAPALANVGAALRTAFTAPDTPLPPAAKPAFVRADAAAPVVPDKPKSRTPLFAGIGVAALLVAGGGYFALSGGGDTRAPTLASAPPGDAAASGATVAAPGRVDFATVRPQLLAALAAVPCSDLRLAGPPDDDGHLQLVGWRASGSPLPRAPAGFSLDSGDAATITSPSRETCEIIGKLRDAVPAGDEGSFGVTGSQRINYTTAAKNPDGSVSVDLGVKPAPPGKPDVMFISVADVPQGKEDRIQSVPAKDYSLSALAFEQKANRYLAVVIAGAALPPPQSWPLDTRGLVKACSGGRCALASGWIELTP